ncbi:hypothetical protein [Marivita hallyeonensis]|uniref:Uncharacterized protein n=1 Tax=Marivita hallyeonensis TaxID=996342 RepID=A0A1M5W147_9RHOB|nr:hypothetical protein [Marivita hallyeonensis]SHH81299.1 hypothetical protein SAMN05443551_3196 [Marivita hallyeonensis]
MTQTKAALIAILLCTPMTASADALERTLTEYVAAFDLSEVTPTSREHLAEIVAHPTMSHGMKVLMVHGILLAEDALHHVDQHGSQPSYMTGFAVTADNG